MDNMDERAEILANTRREYGQTGLRRGQLPEEPMTLFQTWLHDMYMAGVSDPSAMTLASVDEEGQPWQRLVLLKGYDSTSMTFYTNLASRKAQQIKANSKLSLHFPWQEAARQVSAIGIAYPVNREQASQYFQQRPRESQIGAWASRQSTVLTARAALEQRFIAKTEQFDGTEVPLPEFWGGFQVQLRQIEFWQGGNHRLHDRFLYQKMPKAWTITRLAP